MRGSFLLIFIFYLVGCVWIGFRSWQALPRWRWLRVLWAGLIGGLTFAFMVGIVLRMAGGWESLARVCRVVGGAWMVTLPWWCLICFVFEGVRFVAWFRPTVIPRKFRENLGRARGFALLGSVGLVVVVMVIGYVRFANPQVTSLAVTIDKVSSLESVHAVFVADLHSGDVIGRERIADYVRRINALRPEVIFISGDLLDHGLASLIEQDIGAEFQKLHAPLGVFAVLGNHETYSGADASAAYFGRHGIRVLRDEVVSVAGGAFYVAGRDDASRPDRKTVAQLLAAPVAGSGGGGGGGCGDRARPLILLDHQPRDLVSPAAAGVDLQLSGHTHNGQVWPVNWVVAVMYEVAYGYARRGDFQVYVTSGLGLWGLPVRIGTVSEVVDLQIDFRK